MVTVELFTIARARKEPKGSINNERIKKRWYTHTYP